MALEVTKKEKENNSSIVHRFTRSVIQSGIIKEARKRRFRSRPLSDTAKKRLALKKVRVKAEYDKKWKMGEIKK
jgi:ribosomal protein S21